MQRRHFLAGSLALPFLPSLAPRAEAGGAGAAPKRLIIVLTANGARIPHLWPQNVSADLWRDIGTAGRELDLSALPAGQISPTFGPEFEPLRGKLTLVRGLDGLANVTGHKAGFTLTGWYGSPNPSIDQIVADAPSFYPQVPTRRSIHGMIRPQGQVNGAYVSRSVAGTGIEPILNPGVLSGSLFEGFTEDPQGEPDPRIPRRLAVLDHVYEQYTRLRDDARISSADRARLEEHVAMLDDVEQRLATTPVGGQGCEDPEHGDVSGMNGESHIPLHTDLHIETIAAAVKCDLTRVCVLQLCASTDIRTFSFLPSPIGDHHAHSHSFNAGADAAMLEISRWYAQKVAALLTALDTVENPIDGSTYLDNSLVYWGNECGTTTNAEAHLQFSFPVMLAGGAGGFVKPGRLLDYRTIGQRRGGVPYGDFKGRPYNELLVTIAQAMGLTPAEYELHGGPGLGNYASNPYNYALGDRTSPLPGIGG